MLKGFREFILRGNVVDLAVGIVIGAAFTALVAQFTKSFLDPLIKWALPGSGLGGTLTLSEEKRAVIDFGGFLSAIITFVMTAAAIYFLVVLPMNKLAERRARNLEPEPEAPSEEVRLLTDIRDALARH
jgi:large conductance mechanosensitive channel